MLGKWGKISDTLKRSYVDICYLQEARWKVQGTKKIGNCFKLLGSGGCKAENGVVVIIGNWLIGKVVEVERYSERVMKVNIVIRDVFCEVLSTGW